ncbi:MAG TPA: barstar family protein [Herpetosiphonaceae bacterium]
MELIETLRQAAPGGYLLRSRVSAVALGRALSADGWHLGLIDGRRIESKAELLAALAGAFRFPAHVGANWDALADALCDLSWLPAAGYVLFYDRPDPLLSQAPADWAVAAEIIAECAEAWRARGIPFFALLRGAGDGAPDWPAL